LEPLVFFQQAKRVSQRRRGDLPIGVEIRCQSLGAAYPAGALFRLCEATIAGDISGKQNALPHMTANQAVQTAAIAGVRRLLLTHFWYRQDREMLLAEARRTFPASDLAEEMKTYEID
jgi:ribonuclease BN (tRNA processing enzyme)